jgi:hypothetical protein
MVGFFDESEDSFGERGQDSVLCIGGVFGMVGDWAPLEAAWAELVVGHQLGLAEFKMSDAEKGRKEWRGPSQSERWDLQRPFVELFSRNPNPSPVAVAVSIDLSALPPPRGKRPMARAWLLAFQLVVTRMGMAQEMYGLAGEQLALVFDVKNGVKGRATEMWDQAKANPSIGHLLGSLSFMDSKQTPSLQVADMIAYEGRRVLAETIKVGTAPTWQWNELFGAQLPHVGGPRLFCEVLEDVEHGFVDIRERL